MIDDQALVVNSGDVADWYDWMSVSDGGNIRNHDPEGDTLYGIEMQVTHPDEVAEMAVAGLEQDAFG